MFKKKLKTRMRKQLALPLAMLLFLSTASTSWHDAVKAVDVEGTEYVAEEELQEELEDWASPTDVEEDISESEILADAPEDGSAVKIVRSAYKPGETITVQTASANYSVKWYVDNEYVSDTTYTPTEKDYESWICAKAFDGNSLVGEDQIYFSKLPVVYIQTDDGKPVTDKVNYKPGNMFVQGNAEYADAQYDGVIEIKGRGNGSWNYPKKPYKIKLDKSTDLFGMGKNKHWVLISNYMDMSGQRNEIAYNLAEKLGLERMSSVWVNVIFNGEYAGYYTLTEHVRIGETRINIHNWEDEAENIAKAVYKAEKKTLTKDDQSAIEDALNEDYSWMTSGEFTYNGKKYTIANYYDLDMDISGGYLYELDNIYDEKTKFKTDKGLRVQVTKPELLYTNSAVVNSIKAYWNTYEKAYCAEDGYYEGHHYSEYGDFDSMIGYFLVQEIPGNDDASNRSRFAYQDKGGKITWGPAWDYDWGCGSMGVGVNPNGWKGAMSGTADNFYKEWADDPYFCVRLYEAYWAIRPYLDTVIADGGIIDQNYTYLCEAGVADAARWNRKVTWSNARTFESDTTTYKTYLKTRLTWLDKQFADPVTLIKSLGTNSASRYVISSNIKIKESNMKEDTVSTSNYKADGMIAKGGNLTLKINTLDNVVTLGVYVNGLKYDTFEPESKGSYSITIPSSAFTAEDGEMDVVSFIGKWSNGATSDRSFITVLQSDTVEKGTPLAMLYDDRIALSDYQATANDVQISNQVVTSKKVGTNSADDAVVVVANGQLIAVGTGTATVTINGKVYDVTVSPAPISMVLITGHSLGEGLYGNGNDSILCDDGWAYDTRRTASLTSDMGIGYGSSNRPEGIDALVSSGSGVQGNDSALAYEWKKLTGEKLWVINAAVGGSNLTSWTPGTVYSGNYNTAVTLFKNAEAIMKNEVAAGHYIFMHMGVVNHCSENGDETKNPTDYDKQFDAMWNGFRAAFSIDMNGDGQKETVDCIALAPVWKMYVDRSNDAKPIDNPYEFTSGRLVNYHMAYYEDDGVILSTNIGRQWLTDDAVVQFFNQHPVSSYFTKTHGSSLPGAPTAMKNYKVGTTQCYGITADGIHYGQLGYNIVGLEIMDSMYKYWYGTNQASSVQLLLADGKTVVAGTSTSPYKLAENESIYVVPDTQTAAKLTFEATGSIVYEYPCQVRATCTGQGTLTIKAENGTVLNTVVFQVGNGSQPPSQHVCGIGTLVKAVNATCTTAGSKSYYTCSCGKNYEDAACKTEISNINTWKVVAALGHDYGAATCTDKAKCSRCGATTGNALGHDYGAATCTDKAKCTRCGATTGNALGHDMTAATCTEVAHCTRCTYTEGKALGHDYGAATCTDKAKCSRCGATTGNALGHDMTTATCTEAAHCTRCTYTEGKALGHDYGAATCTDKAKCSRCGATTGNTLGHDMTAATCTEAAHCTRCTYTEGEALGHYMVESCTEPAYCKRTGCTYTEGKALGHDFTGEYDGYDANSHWHICNRVGCDATDKAVAHFGGTATINKAAVCSGCGRYYGDTLKKPVVSAPSVKGTVVYDPDKTLANYTLVGTDASCDGKTVKGTWTWKDATIIPKVSVTKYTAVFTPSDLTKYVPVEVDITVNVAKATPVFTKLPSIGAITYGQKVSEAEISGGISNVAGTKNWTSADGALVPTVTEAAARTFQIEFKPVDSVNYETLILDVTVPVLKAETAPNMPAASISPAYDVDNVSAISLGTNWKWSDKDAKASLTVGTSYVATAIYTGTDAGSYETETVKITITRSSCNHTLELRGTKNATCKEAGYTGDYYCKTCGELVNSGEAIEKLPHQGGTANCRQGKVCTVCGTEYGEVDSSNHVETEVRNKVTASCTEDGYSGDTYCKICNTLVEQGKVDKKATGHNYKGVVTTEPTYDEEGVMTYTCIICQDTYTETIAKRLVDVPFCKENSKIRGWDAIAEYASQVRPEEVVTVDMNGAVTVPADMLRAIRGKDVAVKFEMSDTMAWTIGGKYITTEPETDVDLRVWVGDNDIPTDVINATADGKMYVALRFAMVGALGFDTTINVNFNNFGGLIANVFQYDATTGELAYVNSDRVTRNGTAAMSINEARDYVIIISENSMEPKKDPEEQKPEEQKPEEQKPEEQKPSTEAPSTEKPSTEAPSTEKPSTEAPSTEAPNTQAPAADVPSTQKPAHVTYQSTNTSGTSGNATTTASTTEEVEEEKTTEEKVEKETTTEEVTEAEVNTDETIIIEDDETPLANGTDETKHNRIWLKIVICLIAIAAAMGLGLILWAKRRDRLY